MVDVGDFPLIGSRTTGNRFTAKHYEILPGFLERLNGIVVVLVQPITLPPIVVKTVILDLNHPFLILTDELDSRGWQSVRKPQLFRLPLLILTEALKLLRDRMGLEDSRPSIAKILSPKPPGMRGGISLKRIELYP